LDAENFELPALFFYNDAVTRVEQNERDGIKERKET